MPYKGSKRAKRRTEKIVNLVRAGKNDKAAKVSDRHQKAYTRENDKLTNKMKKQEAKKALGASFWSYEARKNRAKKRKNKEDDLNKKNDSIAATTKALQTSTTLAKQTGSAMKKPNMSRPAKQYKEIEKGASFNPKLKKAVADGKIKGKFAKEVMGSSMGYGKKHGASMNAYQDKEASMDDYSHEKKLKADGRYEAAHGKMANAENDFNHAHALKKDAHHDARGRHAIMKHMKGH